MNNLAKSLSPLYLLPNGDVITQTNLRQFLVDQHIAYQDADGYHIFERYSSWFLVHENETGYLSLHVYALGIQAIINALSLKPDVSNFVDCLYSIEALRAAGIIGQKGGVCDSVPYKKYSDLLFPFIKIEDDNITFRLKLSPNNLTKLDKIMQNRLEDPKKMISIEQLVAEMNPRKPNKKSDKILKKEDNFELI